MIASLASFVVGTIAIAVLKGPIVDFYSQPDLLPWLWLVPAIAGTIGVYLVLNQLAVRRRRFGLIAQRNLLQSVTTVATQAIAGVLGLSVGGLISGLGLGQALGAAGLLSGSGLRTQPARTGMGITNLRQVARHYRRFPLILAPSGLVNVAGLTLPVLFVASYYGLEVAGWLGLTQRVLSLPVSLIGAAVGQVYISALAEKVRTGEAGAAKLFSRTSRRLASIGIVGGSLLLVLGPLVFTLVFGTEWAESGAYAQALSINLVFQFFAGPLSQTIVILEPP